MSRRILIFGNSGSGKSTIAKKICQKYRLPHLDLDTLAWLQTNPPSRKPISESKKEIDQFVNQNNEWVIEGCYSDLIELAIPDSTEVIYMNLPVELCIENAKSRPWEPHKYKSKEAQNENLGMLIEWIKNYSTRTDTFSEKQHQELFESYKNPKKIIIDNSYKL